MARILRTHPTEELKIMGWIIQHPEQDLWAGNRWTHATALATVYDDPDKAQVVADAFHLADCTYDRNLARNTKIGRAHV